MRSNFFLAFIFIVASITSTKAQVDTIYYQNFENIGPITTYNVNGNYIVNGISNVSLTINNAEVKFNGGNTTSGVGSFSAERINPTLGSDALIAFDSINLMGYDYYNKIEIKYNYIHPDTGLILYREVFFGEGPNAPAFMNRLIYSHTLDTSSGFQSLTLDLDSFLNVKQIPFTDTSQFSIYQSSVGPFPFKPGFTIDDILITASINEATHHIVQVLSDTIACNYSNKEVFSLLAENYNTNSFSDSVQVKSILKDNQGTIIQIDSNVSFVNALAFESYTIKTPPLNLGAPGRYDLELILQARNDTFPDDDTIRKTIINNSILPLFTENFEAYQFSGSNEVLPNLSNYWLANGSQIQRQRQNIGKGWQTASYGPSKDHTLGTNNGKYAFISTNAQNLDQVELELTCFNGVLDSNKLIKLAYYYHGYEQDNSALSLNIYLEDEHGNRQLIQHKNGDSIAQEFPSVNSNWRKDSVYFSAKGYSSLIFQGKAKASARADAIFIDDIKIDYVDSTDIFLRYRSPDINSYTCPDSVHYEFDVINASSDTIDLSINTYQVKSYIFRSNQMVDSFLTVVNGTNYPSLWIPNSDLKIQYKADLSIGGNYKFISNLVGNSDFIAANDTIETNYNNTVITGNAFEVPTTCPSDSESVVLIGSNGPIIWQQFDSLSMSWNDLNSRDIYYRTQLTKPSAFRAKVCNVYSNIVSVTPKISQLFNSDTLSLASNDSILFSSNTTHTNVLWNDTNNQSSLWVYGANYNLGDTVVIKQIATDTAGCLLTDSILIYIDFPISISEYQNQTSVTVSPNPSFSGTFNVNIENNNPIYFSVLDMKGQVVIGEKISSSNNFKVDLSKFSNGMYLLKLRTKREVITKKLIKN